MALFVHAESEEEEEGDYISTAHLGEDLLGLFNSNNEEDFDGFLPDEIQ